MLSAPFNANLMNITTNVVPNEWIPFLQSEELQGHERVAQQCDAESEIDDLHLEPLPTKEELLMEENPEEDTNARPQDSAAKSPSPTVTTSVESTSNSSPVSIAKDSPLKKNKSSSGKQRPIKKEQRTKYCRRWVPSPEKEKELKQQLLSKRSSEKSNPLDKTAAPPTTSSTTSLAALAASLTKDPATEPRTALPPTSSAAPPTASSRESSPSKAKKATPKKVNKRQKPTKHRQVLPLSPSKEIKSAMKDRLMNNAKMQESINELTMKMQLLNLNSKSLSDDMDVTRELDAVGEMVCEY